MRLVGVGFRGLMYALSNGEPVWPALTIFLVSILIAVVVAAFRYSRR